MDQGERRIHSLKLRGGENAMLSRVRYRLEEAFRTATLPGLPPNAQVLIRRFDLGSISGDASPASLAEIISEKVRTLAGAAVCLDYDSQSRPDADVVWFRDAFQPYAVLLARLLDGKPANEWYWRSLFPGQALTLTSETLERLLIDSMETPLKALAPARLLQCTLTPQRMSRLCPHLTQATAMRLLHRQGLSPVAVRWRPVDGQTRHSRNVRDAQQAVPAPQPDGSAFAGQRMQSIAALIVPPEWRRTVQMAADYWGVEDVRTLWYAWQVLVMQQSGYAERKDGLQHIDVAGWLANWALVGSERNEQITPDFPSSKGNDVSQGEQGEKPNHVQTLTPAHASLPLLQWGTREDLSECEQADIRVRIEALTGHTPAKELFAPHSRHAGFAFVIAILQRLGMSELLEHNDVLLEHDFTRHLLWTVAERFAVAEDDPPRQLFDAWEPGADVGLDTIVLPEFWPRMASAFGRPLSRHPTTLRDLINATQLMTAVYLRRFCGISLRTLLRRHGRVLLTPTHWDVIFDINQTDLRLRRAALDTNPGWVPWLGRVVQFHYDSEGQRYV